MPSPLVSVRRSTRWGNSLSSPALLRFVPDESPTKSCPGAPSVAIMGCCTSGGAAATSATSPSGRSIGGKAAIKREKQRLQLRRKAKVQYAEQGFMHGILPIPGTKSSRERPCFSPTRKSSGLAGHLRGEVVQIKLTARRGERVRQQVPILGERSRTSRRDVIARAVRLQLAGRDLPGLRIPEAKSQTGDFRIDAVRRRRVALHERLMVRHHIRKPAGVRKLKSIGVGQHFNPPHALRQFGCGHGDDEAEQNS